ncbi:hypothetical protein [Caballeronia sp. Lep1P3]|uniref:hypothetical protein n=1 Tax=Caballeronia sp. Lep1P3 TaxID=2878150 RepID=UPI001FD3EB3A|nr:hypothetical protein [Caballeronia sp. Lep1P3]
MWSYKCPQHPVSETTIKNWFNAVFLPRKKLWPVVARLLNRSGDWLMDGFDDAPLPVTGAAQAPRFFARTISPETLHGKVRSIQEAMRILAARVQELEDALR